MQQLSDPGTRLFKLQQVGLVSVAVAAVLIWQCFGRTPRISLTASLLLMAAMAVLVPITLWRRVWYVADAVLQDGNALLARRGGREVRVPLSDITAVQAVSVAVREGIQLTLREQVAPFGARIVFLPPNWRALDSEQMARLATMLSQRLGIATGA